MIHRCCIALLMSLLLVTSAAQAQERESSATGVYLPGLDHLDRVMREVIREQHLPGGTLAIMKDGRLVFARGYGWANVGDREPVTPDTLFNLASCTKAFTGAACLKLVDEGKLDLDTPFLKICPELTPKGRFDPRIQRITVRQLLYHAAGFRHDFGRKDEVRGIREHIRLGLHEPLEFDPGTRSQYSNAGFEVLKVVVADAAGEPYERYVKEHVLAPAGIRNMQMDIRDGYVEGEAHRYRGGREVDGGHHAFPVMGCWLASSVDMVRFLSVLDGSRGKAILSKEARAAMVALPGPPYELKKSGKHPGLGWDIAQATDDGVLYQKNGGIAGIATLMGHLPNGVNFAICFNGSPTAREKEQGFGRPYAAVRKAIGETNDWPQKGDLLTPRR